MNKKTLFTLALAAMTLTATAAPLTPQEALGKALGDAPAKMKAPGLASYRLASTKMTDGKATVYLFDRAAAPGYIVVAADDAVPALLGYSDAQLSKEGETAPSFDYWIQSLGRQIARASALENESGRRVLPKYARPERAVIKPLCTTEWTQDAPYNNYCPKMTQQPTVTGCVATAMSQVMKYHNWPQRGTGLLRYVPSGLGRQLSLDLSKIPEFDWGRMLDNYNKVASYTDEEAKAVANLMRAAGYSVEMNYGTEASGAQQYKIVGALVNNFYYDKGIRYLNRNNYYMSEWENEIYKSLSEDGPVILGGQSTMGGHSFVCDGYDKDGYFHINWGWGGMSDGYFLLGVLDPYDQGIGGSLSNDGFNFEQDAVVGIRPDKDGTSKYAWNVIGYSGPGFEKNSGDGRYLHVSGAAYNFTAVPVQGEVGVSFTPVEEYGKENAKTYVSSADLGSMPVGQGFEGVDFPYPSDMPDGEYIAKWVIAYKDEAGNLGEFQDMSIPAYDSRTATITKKGMSYTVEENGYECPELKDFYITPRIDTLDDEIRVTGTLVYDGETPWYGLCSLIVLNEAEDELLAVTPEIVLDMEPGDKLDINEKLKLSEYDRSFRPGSYKIALASSTSYVYVFLCDAQPFGFATSGIQCIGSEPAEALTGDRDYYTLTGVKVASAAAGEPAPELPAGVYVVRSEGGSAKVTVK